MAYHSRAGQIQYQRRWGSTTNRSGSTDRAELPQIGAVVYREEPAMVRPGQEQQHGACLPAVSRQPGPAAKGGSGMAWQHGQPVGVARPGCSPARCARRRGGAQPSSA